jgi:hypothetical protein
VKKLVYAGMCLVILSASIVAAQVAAQKEVIQYVDTPSGRWMVHDDARPAPRTVHPGTCGLAGQPAKPPSDAIILFDGRDLSKWTDEKGQPSKWLVRDGYLESVRGAGYVRTRQEFGSCQLHVEFATPSVASGSDQNRGNSGIFLHGYYEVQVLDSFENSTYADGQCGALYGRAVPLVNASCGPGEWQAYDIVYHRPVFDASGKVSRKARFTILHNGVLIQDNVELQGGTGWVGRHSVTDYVAHGDKGPLMFQDHSSPVRFRNVWIRELAD